MSEPITAVTLLRRLGVSSRTVHVWVAKGILPSVETPIRTGKGVVHLIPAEALETFERPKLGYPKGRPRKPNAEAVDGDQETD